MHAKAIRATVYLQYHRRISWDFFFIMLVSPTWFRQVHKVSYPQEAHHRRTHFIGFVSCALRRCNNSRSYKRKRCASIIYLCRVFPLMFGILAIHKKSMFKIDYINEATHNGQARYPYPMAMSSSISLSWRKSVASSSPNNASSGPRSLRCADDVFDSGGKDEVPMTIDAGSANVSLNVIFLGTYNERRRKRGCAYSLA